MPIPPDLNLSDAEWMAYSVAERAVQWARYYADKAKVREEGGNNHGAMVEMFLRTVGLSAGQPWCAAFVSHCLANAGWHDFKAGGVLSWKEWAESHGVLVDTPKRGDLAFWDRDGQHHIGIVIGSNIGGTIGTIEGNTSSGEAGSQNNGDGVYRRNRKPGAWTGFIRWSEAK